MMNKRVAVLLVLVGLALVAYSFSLPALLATPFPWFDAQITFPVDGGDYAVVDHVDVTIPPRAVDGSFYGPLYLRIDTDTSPEHNDWEYTMQTTDETHYTVSFPALSKGKHTVVISVIKYPNGDCVSSKFETKGQSPVPTPTPMPSSEPTPTPTPYVPSVTPTPSSSGGGSAPLGVPLRLIVQVCGVACVGIGGFGFIRKRGS